MQDSIIIKGARVHNLKNVDVEIPRNTMTVVTGISGSGKSSLINALTNRKNLAYSGKTPGKRLPVAAVKHNGSACLIQRLGDGIADAVGGAGHQGKLTL